MVGDDDDNSTSSYFRRGAEPEEEDLVDTTIVRCCNLRDRAYPAAVTPGHVLVVRFTLARAGRH
ncbi:hypothetical protein ASF24_19045 [Methylobacterium sp. Leaf86]|nr:hypothetical protein ASF24_19045 [Methylobacterium sp. Leaf86]